LKEAADINTVSLAQYIVCQWLDQMDCEQHIAQLLSVYRERREKMVSSIRDYFPVGTKCGMPSGGFFAWVSLRDGLDTEDLCRQAIQKEKIAFLPGRLFAVGSNGRASSCMRLSYSNSTPAIIEDGIRRLGGLIKMSISDLGGAA
jgi:2-aminoadipate transaminase